MARVTPAEYGELPESQVRRFGNLVSFDEGAIAAGDIVIIGHAQDEDIVRNGGREGARDGPKCIRGHLCDRFAPEELVKGGAKLVDLGDVTDGELASTQKKLGELVARVLEKGATPIVLGGGHGTTYGHFWAYVELVQSVAIFNVDPHPDTQKMIDSKGHSGSAMRQALKHPSRICEGYAVYGIRPEANAPEVMQGLDELASAGAVYRTLPTQEEHDIQEFFEKAMEPFERVLVTIDLDSIRAVEGGGVSSPQLLGVSVEDLIAFAEFAGGSEKVTSFDIVELSPCNDFEERTAKAATEIFLAFLQARLKRKS